MKKLFSATVILIILSIAAIVLAADAATVPQVSLFDWFLQNKAAILAAALAFSEVLSLIPAFKGNGIIDTIIKALQTLSGKDPAA